MRLKATWVVEYDADPKHYGTNDAAELTAIEEAGDVVSLMTDADTVSFKVEQVLPAPGSMACW
jgi:hypothetical protein